MGGGVKMDDPKNGIRKWMTKKMCVCVWGGVILCNVLYTDFTPNLKLTENLKLAKSTLADLLLHSVVTKVCLVPYVRSEEQGRGVEWLKIHEKWNLVLGMKMLSNIFWVI